MDCFVVLKGPDPVAVVESRTSELVSSKPVHRDPRPSRSAACENGQCDPKSRDQCGSRLRETARVSDSTDVSLGRKNGGDLALSATPIELKRATRRANPRVTGGVCAAFRSARRCS
jgi:hypothetical protein